MRKERREKAALARDSRLEKRTTDRPDGRRCPDRNPRRSRSSRRGARTARSACRRRRVLARQPAARGRHARPRDRERLPAPLLVPRERRGLRQRESRPASPSRAPASSARSDSVQSALATRASARADRTTKPPPSSRAADRLARARARARAQHRRRRADVAGCRRRRATSARSTATRTEPQRRGRGRGGLGRRPSRT